MLSRIKLILLLASFAIVGFAQADWHEGKVTFLGAGYSGRIITVKLNTFNKPECACDSSWTGYMCLDETRQSFDFEKALLLSAKARGTTVKIRIDPQTCKIQAMYEAG